MLGMHVPASLSLVELEVVDSEFASQDVSYSDFILALDEGSHRQLDKWQSINAFFLVLEFLLVVISSEKLFCHVFPGVLV